MSDIIVNVLDGEKIGVLVTGTFPTPVTDNTIVITPADTVDVQARGSFPVGIEGYDTAVVTVAGGPQGPTGPRGPSGTGVPGGTKGQFLRKKSDIDEDMEWSDPAYVFEQSTPQREWLIEHNLGRSVVSVHVTDSAGTVCVGEIQHIDYNNTILRFGASFSGKAVLL